MGHFLLNVVDFPESSGAGKAGPREGGSVKRVVDNKGMARQDAFFFIDVSPMTKMRPAGEGGSSLALSRLDMQQFDPVGLHFGGKILPSFRLDGFPPETNAALTR